MLLRDQLQKWPFPGSDPNRDLVSRAKAGDRRAFDQLVKTYGDQLRGFVALRVGAECADDVLQETWMACWVGLSSFGSRSGFKSWLYGIAANKCTDQHRARARVAAQSVEELEDLADQENAYAKVDLREAVRTVLAQLPDAQREVVELYYYAGLTLPEIAESLKRNLSTVKYQFYRAHDQVAQLLAEPGNRVP